MATIQSYLNKRGINKKWAISPTPNKKFNQVVVIPAYAELEMLPGTLNSLNVNQKSILNDTLVIVVINNSDNCSLSIKINNQETMKFLISNTYHFTLGIVDAFSSYHALSDKQSGVGFSRKIGIDLALPYLTSTNSLILCTDADTIVNNKYITKIIKYFYSNDTKAAVVGFCHRKSKNENLEKAIREYEKYLNLTAKNIKAAGSPYGYVAMGSTMVCTAEAYCAVGGMPAKKATEDFYFLQELSKYCNVDIIPEILVHPSPRPITRVYLGTGFRMEQIDKGFDLNNLYYSNKSFQLLSSWIKIGSNAWKIDLSQIKKKLSAIDPNLIHFLQKEGIDDIWEGLQINAPTASHFSKQFHRWFDGLKTIRLLKQFTVSSSN